MHQHASSLTAVTGLHCSVHTRERPQPWEIMLTARALQLPVYQNWLWPLLLFRALPLCVCIYICSLPLHRYLQLAPVAMYVHNTNSSHHWLMPALVLSHSSGDNAEVTHSPWNHWGSLEILAKDHIVVNAVHPSILNWRNITPTHPSIPSATTNSNTQCPQSLDLRS